MSKIKNIRVYKQVPIGHPEEVVFSGNYESCRNYIGNQAKEFNCGVYRYWKVDNHHYFDCGKDVLYTKVNIRLAVKLGNNDSLDPEEDE